MVSPALEIDDIFGTHTDAHPCLPEIQALLLLSISSEFWSVSPLPPPFAQNHHSLVETLAGLGCVCACDDAKLAHRGQLLGAGTHLGLGWHKVRLGRTAGTTGKSP